MKLSFTFVSAFCLGITLAAPGMLDLRGAEPAPIPIPATTIDQREAEAAPAAMPQGSATNPPRPIGTVGAVTVNNYCSSTIYVRVANQNVQGGLVPMPPSTSWSQGFVSNGNGIDFQVAPKDPNPLGSSNVLHFYYSVHYPNITYALSTENGDPFQAQGFKVTPSESGCPTLLCSKGANPCKRALPYFGQFSSCEARSNMRLNICADF